MRGKDVWKEEKERKREESGRRNNDSGRVKVATLPYVPLIKG